MPNEFPRSRRVAEQIKRELSVLISAEVKDPRVRLVTVTDVEVSRDLAHAKVFVGILEMAAEPAEVLAGLNKAAGFLRGRLGRELRLRVTPELRFIEDTTERDAQHLSSLIDEAVEEDRRRH
jgi:ribosome-binding factor A